MEKSEGGVYDPELWLTEACLAAVNVERYKVFTHLKKKIIGHGYIFGLIRGLK
jgi:hypothetical protein